MKKYIHYGSKHFDSSKFVPIKNQTFIKPLGGFWASPVDSTYGWREWNDRSGFAKIVEEESFQFTLKENANVLHIYETNDLKDLPKETIPGFPILSDSISPIYLDFEKILESGVDAIELHLTEERRYDNDFLKGLYWSLYGWDCDSILIMNPDIIEICN